MSATSPRQTYKPFDISCPTTLFLMCSRSSIQVFGIAGIHTHMINHITTYAKSVARAAGNDPGIQRMTSALATGADHVPPQPRLVKSKNNPGASFPSSFLIKSTHAPSISATANNLFTHALHDSNTCLTIRVRHLNRPHLRHFLCIAAIHELKVVLSKNLVIRDCDESGTKVPQFLVHAPAFLTSAF
jgi:hypothetical protein